MEPPDELPPALAAWLLKPPELTPQRLVIAALCDLARRGHLRIERRPSRADARRQRLTLVRLSRSDDPLAPFEQLILDTLLEDAPQADVTHLAAAPLLAKQRLQQTCETELSERGLLDADGARRRRAYAVNAWAVALLGLITATVTVWIAGTVPWWGWALLVLGVLFCWGIGGMYNDVRGVTQRGADSHAAWGAFAAYLKQLTVETAPEGRFAALVPAAVALGPLKPFIAAYGPREHTLPTWYRPSLAAPAAEGKTVALERLQHASLGADELLRAIRDLERELTTPASGS